MMNEGEIASALLKLLALPVSRLAASEIFDLLASPPVSRRFSLDLGELELIRGWIEKSGIRWGMDEGDRTSRNLPAYRDNSWRAGLDRLLLGYAMPDENQLFNGILPYDDISGSVAESLGKFAEFVERVDCFVKSFERSRTLAEWRVQFQAMLARFHCPLRQLRAGVCSHCRACRRAWQHCDEGGVYWQRFACGDALLASRTP